MNINQQLINSLSKIANQIRTILEIPKDQYIEANSLNMLVEKINTNFPGYEIKEGCSMFYNLKEGKRAIIYYDLLADNSEQFEFIIRALCYGVLLDKKELNDFQLKNYTLLQNDIFEDKYAECLSKMVVLPNELCKNEINQFYMNDIISIKQKKINKKRIRGVICRILIITHIHIDVGMLMIL